ncbi:MAG: hypothetical protein IPJ78_13380 [Gemmatimonadetes bacterium]|nr:hypothetical protein [Gemmatimonadota bacterium]
MRADPTDPLERLREEATEQTTALLLGLRNGASVVAWADAAIHASDAPDAALYEVSLTPPGDLSALRHALAPLAHDPVPERTVRAMLALAADDLAAGRRRADDTVRVLAQMRRMLPLPADVGESIDRLKDGHMLAEVGLGMTVDEAESRVREWLQSMGTGAAAARPLP